MRKFSFKDKTSHDVYNIDLADGSFLVMGAHCQEGYTHSLLKNPAYRKVENKYHISRTEFSIIGGQGKMYLPPMTSPSRVL